MQSQDGGSTGSRGAGTAHGPGVPPGTGRVDRLVAECIARLGAGETVDVEAAAAQLPDDGARTRFRELLAEVQGVQDLLPAQVRPGLLLKGRYRLVREIGSGGMGKVYEAHDIQLERRVAVKVLAALGGSSFDPEQLFMQEAVLLASLQHPNIVAVHELGNERDISFIVMDLVQGTAASDVLQRVATSLEGARRAQPRRGTLLEDAIAQPLPAGRASLVEPDSWFRSAARVVLEVTRTIEEAHGKGVIHRDIKPHNILLRGDGSPVILDFGLAGTLDRAQGAITRGLFGTVGYLAPEQVETSRIGADRRTDVYQLGLLLYEFLTLQRAFPGDQLTLLLARISRGEFRRPRAIDPGIPWELEAICLKAMELDPARRYPTATALREDLQRYLSGSEVPHAARGGVLAAGVRAARYWARRHRTALLVALPLVAALIVVLANLGTAPLPDADVQAFRYSPAEERVTYAPVADRVRPGDVLGVTVSAPVPQHVYALSVFGSQDPPTWVAPMRLVPADAGAPEAAQPDALTAASWGRRVEPGASVNCTQITDGAEDGSYEGLWIFTSPEPQPGLEAWMDRLGALALAAPDQAVNLEQARAAFEAVLAPGATRGGQVQLSAEELARQADSLDAASLLGERDWPFTDPRRVAFSFRVER